MKKGFSSQTLSFQLNATGAIGKAYYRVQDEEDFIGLSKPRFRMNALELKELDEIKLQEKGLLFKFFKILRQYKHLF